MHYKTSFRVKLSVAMLFCLAGGIFAGREAAAGGEPPVKLSAAAVISMRASSFEFSSKLKGRVHVADLAYQKRVFVRYRVRTSSDVLVQDWSTLDAAWVHGEDWEFETPGFYGQCPHYCGELLFELAVGYDVLGRTYWDNNQSANYLFASDMQPIPGDPGSPADLGAAHVMLIDSTWSFSDTIWRGRILIDNLGYQKEVDVVYSGDAWKTSKVAKASFASMTSHGMEYWQFEAPLPPESAQGGIEYAISYRVNGKTTWDNRLGANYRLALPQLVFHETFDDIAALLRPTVGPDGTLTGLPTFVSGVSGNAYYIDTARSGMLSYPGQIIPADRGIIECQVRLQKPPVEIPWHNSPYFFYAPAGDYSQYAIGLNGNDGWGGGGLVAWAGHGNLATGCYDSTYSYSSVLGGPGQEQQWHRFALIWDKSGLPGTQTTMQLYLDGNPVGTSWLCGEDHRPQEFLRPETFWVGHIQDNFAGSAFAIDELKIWAYANTTTPVIPGPACTGTGLIYTIPDQCMDDGGANAGGDGLEVYCLNGVARFCLSGESCRWRTDNPVDDGTTCELAGLTSDYLANAWCSQWQGHANYACDASGQVYFP